MRFTDNDPSIQVDRLVNRQADPPTLNFQGKTKWDDVPPYWSPNEPDWTDNDAEWTRCWFGRDITGGEAQEHAGYLPVTVPLVHTSYHRDGMWIGPYARFAVIP